MPLPDIIFGQAAPQTAVDAMQELDDILGGDGDEVAEESVGVDLDRKVRFTPSSNNDGTM